MCGIFGYLYANPVRRIDFDKIKEGFKKIKHRGPDCSSFHYLADSPCIFGFSRLSINDLSAKGMQPFSDKKIHLICNGEIYNHKELEDRYHIKTNSQSDCEIILHLYSLFGRGSMAIYRICLLLDAEFAFLLYDEETSVLYAARDFGIRPLFYTMTSDGFAFCSEAKGLMGFNSKINPFPPRSWWSSGTPLEFHTYYEIPTAITISSLDVAISMVKDQMVSSVKSRLMADSPLGFFLSGGLDSSLVCSIASRLMNKRIKTFSIGFHGSPDLLAAQVVADYLGTDHTSIIISLDAAITALPDVIRTLESFDTTTIRASTPQYLLSKYIREKTGIRVLLSGEGSDELAYGYLMWHQAPSLEEAQRASFELSSQLYLYDNLRADRTTARWGLEVRVPFLSTNVINFFHSLHPNLKLPQMVNGQKVEKYILRKAFEGYLPSDILWRTKAAFSDAVGSQWVESLKMNAEKEISDQEFSERQYDHCCPRTKEELYYRKIFDSYYPGQERLIPDFWRLRWQQVDDPSARYLKCYRQ